MTPTSTEDELEQCIEAALDVAEDQRVKYHLREALQLRISRTQWERDRTERLRSD